MRYLYLSEAADQAPRAVLAFVAVDQHGVVSCVQQFGESDCYLVVRNVHKRLLVARHADLNQLNAIRLVKRLEAHRYLLGHKGQHRPVGGKCGVRSVFPVSQKCQFQACQGRDGPPRLQSLQNYLKPSFLMNEKCLDLGNDER